MKSSTVIRSLLIILGLSLLAMSIVLLVYWGQFGGELSNRQETWGVFGDFVGGSLNPIFSLAGLVALLITIALQSQELEATRKELQKSAVANQAQAEYIAAQQKRDDLFRLINKLTERINNNYNGNFLDEGRSIHHAMMGEHNVNTNEEFFLLYNNANDRNTKTYVILKYIETDLRSLSKLINEYEDASLSSSGATPLPSFYKAEYKEFVGAMHKYSIFKSDIAEFYYEYPKSV